MPVTFGTFSDDNITATDGNDLIISFRGDDFIFAGDGNDFVIAGSGDDTVYGGGGNDVIFGGRGDDALFGEEGNDRLFGGSGDDNLSGGTGRNLLIGGRGFDTASFDGSIFDYDIASKRGLTRVTQTDDTGDLLSKDYIVGIEAMYFAAEDYTLYSDGRDNAVLFTGEDSGAVTEDAGTPATGTLIATDFDGSDGIVAGVGNATYGSFTVGTDGIWTYTLDDGNASVDALNAGEALTDSFDVVADDGTTQTVTVDITGANDAATFGGDLSGSVIEDEGVDATGTATVADVDLGQGSIVASSGSTNYGSYSIDTAGVWTYALDDTNPTVDALGAGDPWTDSFTITSDDGTEQTIDITITGADDGPTGPQIIDLNSGTAFTGTTGVVDNFVLDLNELLPFQSGGIVPSIDITNFIVGEDRMVFTNFEQAGSIATSAANAAAFGEDGILDSTWSISAVYFLADSTGIVQSRAGGERDVVQLNFFDDSGSAITAESVQDAGDFDSYGDYEIPYETVALDALAANDLFVFYADDLIL